MRTSQHSPHSTILRLVLLGLIPTLFHTKTTLHLITLRWEMRLSLDLLATYVPGAINNMYTALNSIGLGNIKVTTVVPEYILQTSYPPSAIRCSIFTRYFAHYWGYYFIFVWKWNTTYGKSVPLLQLCRWPC